MQFLLPLFRYTQYKLGHCVVDSLFISLKLWSALKHGHYAGNSITRGLHICHSNTVGLEIEMLGIKIAQGDFFTQNC